MGNKQEVETLTAAAASADDGAEGSAENSGALLELVKVLRKDKELYEAK